MRYVFNDNPSSWHYYLRFVSFLLFLGVGLVHWQKMRITRKNRPYHINMLTAVVLCVAWMIVALPVFLEALPRLVEAISPLNLLLVIGVFIGYNPAVWKWVFPTLYLIAYGSAVLGLLYAVHLPTYALHEGGNPMYYHITLSIWPAACLLLACQRKDLLKQVLAIIPILACVVLGIYNQNRSWTIVAAILFFLRFVVLNSTTSLTRWLKLGTLALVLLILAMNVSMLVGADNVAVQGLVERLTEDTRSGQLGDFFAQVPISQLIIGGGPEAGYYMPGSRNYQYIDNQFLFLMMKFGILSVLVYVYAILSPAFRLLKQRNVHNRWITYLLVLWVLSLAGLSVYQNIRPDPSNMLMVMLAGKALWESRHGQKAATGEYTRSIMI